MEWMLQVADEIDDMVAVVRLFTMALAAEFGLTDDGGMIAIPADPPAL
jgi:hypothetical protein